MRTVLTSMFLLAAASLCGCGDKPPTQIIAEPAMQTMEKAQAVDAIVQQQKADTDAAVEAQGQ